jgi:hypothetical protein
MRAGPKNGRAAFADHRQCLAGISQLPAHQHHQAKPKKRNDQAAMPYWMPITLWSVEKMYFRQKMGFRRSVRMGSGVHAKKNLPHQLLKDKGRLQSVKCRHADGRPRAALPAGLKGHVPCPALSGTRDDGCV